MPRGIYKRTKEHGINIGLALKGKPKSEEAKENMSKIKRILYIEGNSKMGFQKGHKDFVSKKTRKVIAGKLSEVNKGKHPSKKTRKKISKAMKGKHVLEKHPNWQGGLSFEPYDKSFNNKFKRAIRKRDNQVCMLCGIHREKLNESLCVHHINYDKLMSIPQNCISLCRKCHMGTNFNRLHWQKFFQSLLKEKYDYQYSENKEVILNLMENPNGI